MSESRWVIVGAGISGLGGAYHLIKKGVKNITILEAQERVGGRICSLPLNGSFVEIGAQWIHGLGENPIWKLVQDFKVCCA